MKTYFEKSEVLMMSEIDWDYLWQRHQIFASQYALKGHRVTYVNRPGMRLPRFTDIPYILKRFLARPLQVKGNENLNVISSIFFPGNSFISKVLNKYIFIPRLIKNVNKGNLILHVYQPTNLITEIVKQCRNATVVYDCVQNFNEHPASTFETPILEEQLIRRANVFITDSTFLQEKHWDLRESVKVSPGVDFEFFSQTLRGDENKIRKKALYYGHVRDDLDFNLINKLVNDFSLEVEFVGTIQNDIKHLLDKKIKLSDKVAYDELPNIIKPFDFLLLPYKVNAFTKAIIPAKFMECLASGKPIIASRLPAFEKYSECLYFFDCLDLNKVEMHNSVKQQNLAKLESWEDKFESFYSKI